MKGNVILLNGCSSSGKTTLALKLQTLLPVAYQHIALDQYRDGMPGRVRGLNAPPSDQGSTGLNVVPARENDEWVTHIKFGDYGERVLQAMRRSIATFSELGCPVIVDDLLFKREYLDDYVAVLDPKITWFVGVKCSREVIVQREAMRPGRFPGTAQAHYEQVHAHGAAYDIEVDTSSTDVAEVAMMIIQRMQSSPRSFQTLKR